MLSYRTRIFYLLILILFSLSIFAYLLDSWQVINLEEYLPGLSKQAPLVSDAKLIPSDIDWARLEKEQKNLDERKLKIEEENTQLNIEKEKLNKREEVLAKKLEGLVAQQELFEQSKQEYYKQDQNIKDLANRIQFMPPEDAVEIIANWSNSNLVRVLLQMDKNAKASGKKSIVSYLLTLLPRERAGLIMTMMLDSNFLKESIENTDKPPQ